MHSLRGKRLVTRFIKRFIDTRDYFLLAQIISLCAFCHRGMDIIVYADIVANLSEFTL